MVDYVKIDSPSSCSMVIRLEFEYHDEMDPEFIDGIDKAFENAMGVSSYQRLGVDTTTLGNSDVVAYSVDGELNPAVFDILSNEIYSNTDAVGVGMAITAEGGG